MSNESSRIRHLRDITEEYSNLFSKTMESKDRDRIGFMMVFYNWIDDLMRESIDENEKAFAIRSAFAIAKRLLDSKLDGARLSKIGQMIEESRSIRGDMDTLFIAEHLKLQFFEDCKLDSKSPDWELVDKYLNYWINSLKEEKIEIAYYCRDENGRIIEDNERVLTPGPSFFRHCAAECVEWFFNMELKPIDYTPESLMELDRVIDSHWPRELFRDISITNEDPHSIVFLRLVLMTGSYFGEVLVRRLGGEWERTEDLGWHIRIKEARVNVFNIAEKAFREMSNFHKTFKLLEKT